MIYDFKKFRFAWPKYILIPFSSYSHKDEFSDHSPNIKLFLTIFTKFYYRPNTEIEIRTNFKVAFNVAKTSCIKIFSVQTIKIRTSLGRLHLIHCREAAFMTLQLYHTRHLASLSFQPMHCHRSSWQCAAGKLSYVALSYVVRVLVHKDNTFGWGHPCFSWWSVQERIVELLWLSTLSVLYLFVCRYIHFSHDRLCWCSR